MAFVVSSRMGATQQILSETCGLPAYPGNTAEVAVSLRRLIEDQRLQLRLDEKGLARVRELCHHAARIEESSALLALVVSSSRYAS